VSSTSEELASQAEQLQSTISFFRIEETRHGERTSSAPIDRAVTQLRSKAGQMQAAERSAKKPVPARKPARALKVAGGGGWDEVVGIATGQTTLPLQKSQAALSPLYQG
jgi:methyl-accepting chemotaxis protein